MTQQVSSGSSGTASLIRDAYRQAATNTVMKNAEFLDDEKLPEGERMEVLREIFHRNIRLKQLERLARCLSPVVGGIQPANLLVYGPSGTGKSVTCLHFLANLAGICAENGVPFRHCYVDLTTPRTCFGALNELAIAIDPKTKRYRKGIALEHMQDIIVGALQNTGGFLCVLVDEADNITADEDVFLTFLAKTLPKRVPVKLIYVFLTNRLEWDKNLDPRIVSVLKKQDLIFEPYDAMDLMEILRLRVEKALHSDRVIEGAIEKIAAYASRETGDARKAVELLSKAAKIAEETSGRLSEVEVDLADRSLEVDKTRELIASLAVQQRLALKACYTGLRRDSRRLSTGSAFEWYRQLCDGEGLRPLTQRRFSDMVSFMDVYGLVNARVASKGRYGQTREITGALPAEVIQELIGTRVA